MQQHSSGQPPEKKLRMSANYATGDPSNYEYQVKKNMCMLIFINKKKRIYFSN